MSLSAKSSKEEVEGFAFLGAFQAMSELFCGPGYHPETPLQLVIEKMQMSHMFRIKMQHSPLSQQKVGNTYF